MNKPKLKAVLRLTPPEYDSDDIRFMRGVDGVGYGYRPKNDHDKICLVKCPNCERENYALSVASGQCAWCGKWGSDYIKLLS